jgi:hypothetical protein
MVVVVVVVVVEGSAGGGDQKGTRRGTRKSRKVLASTEYPISCGPRGSNTKEENPAHSCIKSLPLTYLANRPDLEIFILNNYLS